MLANAKSTNAQDRRSSIKACPPFVTLHGLLSARLSTVATGPEQPFHFTF
jgi:hypothetical protein